MDSKKKSKLTVLHLASWYPNPSNKMLGIFIKKHIQLINNEINQGIIYFHTTNALQSNYQILYHQSPLHEIEITVKKDSFLKYFFYMVAFYKALKLFKKKIGEPDILHLHVILPLAPVALIYKILTRKPLVFTEHWTGYQPEDGNYRGIPKKWLTKKIVNNSVAGITVSKHLAQTMHNLKLFFNEVVISNVVDIETFNIEDKAIRKGQFIHISSFDERQKNIKGILNAFKLAHEQNPELTLILVGPLENATEAQNFVSKHKLNNFITFVGTKTGNELAALIKSSEALILFSNYENQPVVILEALSCGTPVISTNVGGINEVINNQNGILIEPQNEIALKEAILNMASHTNNFEAKNIRNKIIELINPEKIKQLHLNLYKQLLADA